MNLLCLEETPILWSKNIQSLGLKLEKSIYVYHFNFSESMREDRCKVLRKISEGWMSLKTKHGQAQRTFSPPSAASCNVHESVTNKHPLRFSEFQSLRAMRVQGRAWGYLSPLMAPSPLLSQPLLSKSQVRCGSATTNHVGAGTSTFFAQTLRGM